MKISVQRWPETKVCVHFSYLHVSQNWRWILHFSSLYNKVIPYNMFYFRVCISIRREYVLLAAWWIVLAIRCFIKIHCGAYRLLSQPSFLSFINQLLLRKRKFFGYMHAILLIIFMYFLVQGTFLFLWTTILLMFCFSFHSFSLTNMFLRVHEFVHYWSMISFLLPAFPGDFTFYMILILFVTYYSHLLYALLRGKGKWFQLSISP